jgi:hypothetical protein
MQTKHVALLLLLGNGYLGCAPASSTHGLPSPGRSPSGDMPTAGTDSLVGCVIVDGKVRGVQASRDPSTGELMVGNIPLLTAYPVTSPPYASGAEWYENNEPITFRDHRYPKYGMPRTVPPEALRRVGYFRGVPLFAEPQIPAREGPLYVPVEPGCVFQAYAGT